MITRMAKVTAKVICGSKVEYPTTDTAGRYAQAAFYADYADGRNEAWKHATPTLSLTMTLNGAAADLFEQGGRYTVEFTPDEG